MLRRLKFTTKIGLLPALAAVAFVLILAILLVTGSQSGRVLLAIDQGYYASLELNRKLHDELSRIQSEFQDAASMADPGYLADAVNSHESILRTLEAGLGNPVVDLEPLAELRRGFDAYYELATRTTNNLIDGSVDSNIYEDLQSMSQMHQDMLERIRQLTERDKADMADAIATAQQRQKYATLLLAFLAIGSLLLLVGASIVIIRTASRSVTATVDGINALAAGDFSREHASFSSDEMGHMIDRVGHVTDIINSLTDEVEGLIDSVQAGKLDVRGQPDKFEGAYARLIRNINKLIEAFVAPIEVTANTIERISRGDMPAPIADEYRGDFNVTKENLNALISTMNGLIAQVAGMTSAARAGDLEQRGNPEQFSGVWSELVNGINDTLDSVTGPLREFSHAMSSIASGDLTFRSNGNDYQGEFAKLQGDIRATVEKLTDVISGIKASGDSAASVAHELSDGNRSLRQRTDAQATTLRKATQTMAEMTTAVRQSASSAQRAKERVSEASERARKGGSVVSQAVSAMHDINVSSSRIADIINVIDEIAFQTNLLALNAAVEAARAGDEGRGFAVVASEVRNLAGRSATAAREINDLIQDSVKKVGEGSRLVHESGRTLEEIVTAVIEVDEIVGEISDSAQAQANGIDQVSETIAAMDAMTKENAGLADKTVQSSTLMGEEAARLNRLTAFFCTEAANAAGRGPVPLTERGKHASVAAETCTDGAAARALTK